MNIITKIDGPECPQCGCRDCSTIKKEKIGDAFQSIYSCNHCSHRFNDIGCETAATTLEVVYNRTLCPLCGSGETLVTRGPVGAYRRRYHKCEKCRSSFSSKEL